MENNQKTIITSDKPFNMNDKIGYMFGDIGNTLSFSIVNTFLMIYFTNILGITGAQVGILFLLARFIDAFADVTVGRLVDNSKLHENGRFKPWMNRMRYPLLISLVLLFVPWVSDLSYLSRLVYVFVTYLAWGIFYSTVNIPYGSMVSSISSDPNDKTSLSTFRAVGAATGTAFISYVIPVVIYVGTSKKISGNRFFWVVAGCAILAYFCYSLTIRLTTERVRTEKSKPVPLGQVFKGMFVNKALIALVFVDMLLVIYTSFSSITLSYLFDDYFKNSTAMAIALVLNSATVIILAPFSHWIVRTWGRKNSTVVALFLSTIFYGALFVIQTHDVTVYLVLLFFASLSIGMFTVSVWAFITDVIDSYEVQTGVREDGIVYGVNSFSRKAAQAIAGGFSGFMLSFVGYVSSTKGGATQTTEVVNKLYDLATGIPTVLLAVATLILLFIYPLNKKKIAENVAKLAKIHTERPDD
ncbi:MAG: MFS transporter [Lactobacillus sp.]|jgi:GPH family glycoside/pentoside/hexuronide:cation symporter|nr:MAG: MFS transporter [Lactobacillus sp.]